MVDKAGRQSARQMRFNAELSDRRMVLRKCKRKGGRIMIDAIIKAGAIMGIAGAGIMTLGFITVLAGVVLDMIV